MIIAGLSKWHDAHEFARVLLAQVRRVPAHALTETYAVLTQMPPGRRVSADTAASILAARFETTTLALDPRSRARLPRRLADADISGGSTYDALVALEADAHDEELLTLDRRAVAIYARLGVRYRLLQAS